MDSIDARRVLPWKDYSLFRQMGYDGKQLRLDFGVKGGRGMLQERTYC